MKSEGRSRVTTPALPRLKTGLFEIKPICHPTSYFPPLSTQVELTLQKARGQPASMKTFFPRVEGEPASGGPDVSRGEQKPAVTQPHWEECAWPRRWVRLCSPVCSSGMFWKPLNHPASGTSSAGCLSCSNDSPTDTTKLSKQGVWVQTCWTRAPQGGRAAMRSHRVWFCLLGFHCFSASCSFSLYSSVSQLSGYIYPLLSPQGTE